VCLSLLAGVKDGKIVRAYDKKLGDLKKEKTVLEQELREARTKCDQLEKTAAEAQHLPHDLAEARQEAAELRAQALPAKEREKDLAKKLADMVRISLVCEGSLVYLGRGQSRETG